MEAQRFGGSPFLFLLGVSKRCDLSQQRLIVDQFQYHSKSGSGRSKLSLTTTNIAGKVAVVAAKHRRPVPESQGKWQWSQQTIVDQYQYRRESGCGRSKTSSTSTNIAGKVAVVAANYRRPVPISQGKWQWSQQDIPDQYQNRRESGSGHNNFICSIKRVGRERIKKPPNSYVMAIRWILFRSYFTAGLRRLTTLP